jgi:protein-L-isoaspartate(D-aspartate) O-methyltransferase
MPARDPSLRRRHRYAIAMAASAGVQDPRVVAAFAAIPREPFAGPGPWTLIIPGKPAQPSPDADPAHLYQDVLVAIDAARGINIGQPSAHAMWLASLGLRAGETVVQVGTGTGYYTAILAELVGPSGHVLGCEIDPGLAARSAANLAEFPWAQVVHRSGTEGALPPADAVYVNAALPEPAQPWLDALKPGGRLVFPMHGPRSFGAMLRITRPAQDSPLWPARFISRAGFIPCTAPQDPNAGRRLAAVFEGGGWDQVRTFRTDAPDTTCWYAGNGWWLSTADP